MISFGEVLAQSSSSHGDVMVTSADSGDPSPPLAALQTAAAVLLATELQPMDGLQGKSLAETIDMFLSEICSFLKYEIIVDNMDVS